KLSYIVDSTSAPVSVVVPISSWGAYIVGVLGTLLTTHNVTDYTAFGAFMKVIPMNFYAWAALGVILVLVLKRADFGPMKAHEQRAVKMGEVHNPENKDKVDETKKLPISDAGKIRDLIAPVAVLFAATIGFIYWTGYIGAGDDKSIINIFGEAVI